MTANQILNHQPSFEENPDRQRNLWLAEIAYQLAVMNEREAARPECKCVWPMGGSLDSIIKTECPLHREGGGVIKTEIEVNENEH